MGLLRALFNFLLGALLAIINISVISVLPFPFSQFPIFPIFISLALINRTRPTFFWLLFTAVALSDLYRTGMFGVGIITFVLIIAVGVRVSSDVVTHRSLIGCLVISAIIGFMWAAGTSALILFVGWWRQGSGMTGVLRLITGAFMQAGICAVVCGVVYLLMPRWLRNRSPIIIGSRGL